MTDSHDDAGGTPGGAPVWVRHGRRDPPPPWIHRWNAARRPMLVLGGAVVAVVLVPAFVVPDPAVLGTALTLGWLGLLVMIASLWQPSRLRAHAAWLVEVRPPLDDADRFEPQCSAHCICGWQGPVRADLSRAGDDAAGHAPVVDPDVERPLG